MKIKLTIGVFLLTMLCSFWLVANTFENRLVFTNATNWWNEWGAKKSASISSTVPLKSGEIFAEDFENATTWTFVNSDVNEWYIGTATKKSGTKGLYISDDKGVENAYSESSMSEDISHAVSPSFVIPANAMDYIVSFDWKSKGESSYDVLDVWLVPTSYIPTKNKRTNANISKGISIKNNLYGTTSFKRENSKVSFKDFAGQSVKLIFEWRNDNTSFYQKPAAVDNISIYEYTCQEPKDLLVGAIELDRATVNWTAPNATTSEYEILLRLEDDYPEHETGVIAIQGKTSHTFTNLTASTYYYVWYRSACSPTDKSLWIGPVKFMTSCGDWNTPFTENFDTTSLSGECWSFVSAKEEDKYFFEFSSLFKQDGDRGLGFKPLGVSNVQFDSYAISPTVVLKGGMYKVTYFYKTSPTGNNEFEVLLSVDGTDIADFKTVLVDKKIRQQSAFKKETVFINGIAGNVNLAFRANTFGSTTIQIDNLKIEPVICAEPLNMDYTRVTDTSVQLLWEDKMSTEWEYTIVQKADTPGTSGIKTTVVNPVAIEDKSGSVLTQNTWYDYYVRTKCLDGTYGEWFGPVSFKTACNAKAIPYSDGFNTGETDLECWTIIDVEKNAMGASNTWGQNQYNVYEGNRCMSYSATSPQNDDWLISPGFNMTGGLYAITFYYKLNKNTTANVSVKLSATGTTPADFTETLHSKLEYKGDNYTKMVVYAENITGVANIGFHVTGIRGSVQIDAFDIKAVTCRLPDNVELSNITTQSVDISWSDDGNTSWQYYVQPANFGIVLPVGGGSATNTKLVTANRLNGVNTALEPNTEYEVFVRSNCGESKFSDWVGPYKFRTECEVMPLPYREGFNSDSLTQYCWKIIDGNDDAPSSKNYGLWYAAKNIVFEGNQSMYFTNLKDKNNDDWLISPTFMLDKNKIYRVTYMYRTEPEREGEFEVKYSTKGNKPADFTEVLVPKMVHSNVPWQKGKVFLSGIDGKVNIAFHIPVISMVSGATYIDDFFIEEVTTCTEPLTQGAENMTGTSADIFWDNDHGTTNWEYFVRKKAFLIAAPTKDGVAATTNKVTVTKDHYGAALEGNTWYEFYVRTLCDDGSKTEWTGPFYFRTLCTYSTLPYWEGFNGLEESTVPCWSYLDENKDSTTPTGNNIWRQSTANKFEGTHTMNFTQTTLVESDDYLVSPLFKQLDPTKTYRIKFHYLGTGAGDNEMEVLASTKGNAAVDFTHTIAAKASYKTTAYKEAIYYFTGIGPDAYFALRIVGVGAKNITIDNLFIDEVTTCAQPIHPDVKDVTTNGATIYWQDDFGATAWQYRIQAKKSIAPTKQDAGLGVTQKENSVTKDHLGVDLEPNTAYVYYVRTDCGNGKYSEWSGPVAFTTTCPIYQVPFEEGFNSNNRQRLCWSTAQGAGGTTKWTNSIDYPFEGDQLMSIVQYNPNAQANAYLISPTIELVAGNNYVLKYYYKADSYSNNEFEVLLSKSGTAITDFTTTLIAKKVYDNELYVQESVFITGVSGHINIAWHATAKGEIDVSLDKVTIEKAAACAEPSNVRATDFTDTTIEVEWDAQIGVNSWEVYVTEYGSPAPTGVGIMVTGTPEYTATGLTSGKAYHIYVRAKCAGNTGMSNWSTPVNGATQVTVNGACTGAINIPVNNGLDCVQKVGVSSANAPKVAQNPRSTCMSSTDNELWLEFTATHTTHMIEFSNIIGLNDVEIPTFSMTLYSGACSPTIYASQVTCYKWETGYNEDSKDAHNTTLLNLTPGAQYYVRIAIQRGTYLFNTCITTPIGNYVTTSVNGDKYTTEELVKDILIKSDCDLVSNVKYNAGPNPFGNTFGYFNKNGSTFPFEEGIVLATHNIENTPGPYKDFGDAGRRGKLDPWEGDPDLNAVIASIGGDVYGGTKSVSILEFDFVPVNDTIKFEYLMASESYLHNCTVVCDNAGALFAAWLTEVETGQGQNLALVPGTKDPITLSTVRDTERSGARCASVNPEFYGEHYGKGQTNPLLAPINYIGMTVPMSSEPVYVKPGVTYRIKLAIADFCSASHVSSVFFNAKSFDLGTLDLGADLTVEANTAVCSNEAKVIRSGLLTENVEISWMKDDVVIPGANQPDLEVTTAGQYKVIANYPAIDCEVIGTINVEMFTPLSEVLQPALPIEYCRYVLGGVKVDLTQAEASMFKGLDRERYTVTYYTTEEDAMNAENAITVQGMHSVDYSESVQKRYVYVQDTVTGCTEILTVDLIAVKGEVPQKPEDVKVCSTYVFPTLPSNQLYYAEAGAQGTNYKAGDQLIQPGSYTIYIVQDNGGGCYEETSYTVAITAAVLADEFEDKTYTCTVHTLEPLSDGNRYFTKPNGEGIELLPGQLILNTQTIYIYVESEDKLCTDESSFTITYEECPIQKGVSPNGDGLNDTFDLSSNGVTNVKIFNRLGASVYEFDGVYTNQWFGQNKGGQQLPSGTYYYVVVARGEVKTGWVQLSY